MFLRNDYLKSDSALDPLRREIEFEALEKKIFGTELGESTELSGQTADSRVARREERVAGWRRWHAAAVLAVLLLAALAASRFYLQGKGDAGQTARAAGISLKRLTPDIGVAYSAIPPDGRYLGYIQLENGKRSIWVKDIATGGAKQIVPPGDGYDVVQFSPDGKLLAVEKYDRGAPQQGVMRADAGQNRPVVRSALLRTDRLVGRFKIFDLDRIPEIDQSLAAADRGRLAEAIDRLRHGSDSGLRHLA